MSIFSRKGRQTEERSVTLAQLQAILDRSGLTLSGVHVDPDSAMRHSAVWAAIELIANVGASLPIDEYAKRDGKQVQLSLSSVFADPDPDPSVTAVGLRSQILRSAATRGNAYAQLLGAESGTPTGMVAIHPDRAQWRCEKVDGVWMHNLYIDGVKRERWPYGDIWHFALYQQPGSPEGLSPVEYHKQSIGQALAAQTFGQQFFDGGGNPSMIIKPPVRLAEDEAAALKKKVTDVTRGSREPLVMPQEIQIERLSVNADDSQFLDTQRYGVEEIARVFLGGFPELIGGASSGSSVTYANREQRMADWIALSLAPRYLIPLEAALSTLVPPGRWVKHNVNALLRSDLAARYASYKTSAEVSAIMGTPLQTINEMRALEDMPPVEGGDVLPASETSRDLSAAEALQKIYLAVGSVISTDEARQIVNEMTGTSLPTPTPDLGPAARADVAELLERRSEPVWPAPNVNVTAHVHMPEDRTEPPVVNVTNEVHTPEAVVHVEPRIQVDNHVATPEVQVNVPAQRGVRKTLEHDNAGRITAITEEPLP